MGKTWKDDVKRGQKLKFPRVPAMKSSGSGAHQNKGKDARALRRQYREEVKYGWEYVDENRH
jgi:hypothetical protein